MHHGRTEQREDAVAGGLHHITTVMQNRPHHQLQRRLDDGARLLRVEVFDQLHRTLDVSEQDRDHLALTGDEFAGIL